MYNIVEFVSFKLKKELKVADFLIASDEFHSEFLSKQKGYISRKLLVDGELWADLIYWETLEEAKNAEKAFNEDEYSAKYLSFIDSSGLSTLY